MILLNSKTLLLGCLTIATIFIDPHPAQAGCTSNQQLAECKSTYFHRIEQDRISRQNLENRIATIPTEIAAKGGERDSHLAQAAALRKEVQLLVSQKSHLIEMEKTYKTHIIPAIRDLRNSFPLLGEKTIDSLPKIVKLTKDSLFSQTDEINLRLKEIVELLNQGGSAEDIRALLFEKDQLESIQKFSRSFSDEASLRNALKLIAEGKNPPDDLGLPFGTMLLIQEAASVTQDIKSAQEVFQSMQGNINEISSRIEELQVKNTGKAESCDSQIYDLQNRIAAHDRDARHLDGVIADLDSEKSRSIQNKAPLDTNIDRNNCLWGKCEINSHCKHIPNFGAFESSVQSSGSCR